MTNYCATKKQKLLCYMYRHYCRLGVAAAYQGLLHSRRRRFCSSCHMYCCFQCCQAPRGSQYLQAETTRGMQFSAINNLIPVLFLQRLAC